MIRGLIGQPAQLNLGGDMTKIVLGREQPVAAFQEGVVIRHGVAHQMDGTGVLGRTQRPDVQVVDLNYTGDCQQRFSLYGSGLARQRGETV